LRACSEKLDFVFVFSGEYFRIQARYSWVDLGGQAATSGFAGLLGKLPRFTWRFGHLHLKILHSTGTTTTSYCGIDAHGSQFCGFCYQGRGTGPSDWPKVILERDRRQPVKTGQDPEEHAEIQGLTAEMPSRHPPAGISSRDDARIASWFVLRGTHP
jgi:hypothetical protein